MIEEFAALIYKATDFNLAEVLDQMDALAMRFAHTGTEKEKTDLITTFWSCWESWTSPNKERVQLQPHAFYPVLQRFLPYLSDKKARIMLLEQVFLLGFAAKNFEEVMAKHVGPDLQRFNVENAENYMRSIIGFLPAVTDDDLKGVSADLLEILDEVTLYLVTDLTQESLDNLSLILPYLDAATKQEVVLRLKSKFNVATPSAKASMVEGLGRFLVANLQQLTKETVGKLQKWAMRLISGTDDANKALGRVLIEATIFQLSEEDQQKVKFMLRLFT